MARGDWWRLGGTVLGGHPGPEATATYGDSYSLTTFLTGQADSPTGAWPDAVDRYRQLRQYQPHAGDFDTYETIGGRYYFREQHNTTPSLLVAVRPPTANPTAQGGYYLVSSVEDDTTLPNAVARLGFDLLYIASLDEFATTDDVRAALAAQGP